MKVMRFSPFFALLLGFPLAAAKVVYSFFPLFNLTDVVVFGAAGLAFGYLTKARPIPAGLILALPAMLLSGFFVMRLGGENLMSGVGTGWLVSLVVVPIFAIAGVYMAAVLEFPRTQKHA